MSDFWGAVTSAITDTNNFLWNVGTGIYDRFHQSKREDVSDDQWNKSFEFQKSSWQKSYDENVRQFNTALAENKRQYDQNYEFNNSVFEYNKVNQERQYQREDTAWQRQVADLQSAGLSPLAAAGGAAAGNVVSMPSAPGASGVSGGSMSGGSGVSPESNSVISGSSGISSQLASILAGREEAERERQFRSDEAQKQRDWEDDKRHDEQGFKSEQAALDRDHETQLQQSRLDAVASNIQAQIASAKAIADNHEASETERNAARNFTQNAIAVLNVTELNRANTVRELLDQQKFVLEKGKAGQNGLNVAHPIKDPQAYKEACAEWWNRFDAFMETKLGAAWRESWSLGENAGVSASLGFGASAGSKSGSAGKSGNAGANAHQGMSQAQSHDFTSQYGIIAGEYIRSHPYPYYAGE